MSNPVARVVEYTASAPGKQVWTWCPGCDTIHPFTIESDGRLNGGTTWEWDGNLEAPTFSPSLLVHMSVHLCEGEHDPVVCEDPACEATGHALGAMVDGKPTWRFPDEQPDDYDIRGHGQPHTREPAFGPCHSFLRAGVWDFLGDSAHHLAGQQVPMVPLPKSRLPEEGDG